MLCWDGKADSLGRTRRPHLASDCLRGDKQCPQPTWEASCDLRLKNMLMNAHRTPSVLPWCTSRHWNVSPRMNGCDATERRSVTGVCATMLRNHPGRTRGSRPKDVESSKVECWRLVPLVRRLWHSRRQPLGSGKQARSNRWVAAIAHRRNVQPVNLEPSTLNGWKE